MTRNRAYRLGDQDPREIYHHGSGQRVAVAVDQPTARHLVHALNLFPDVHARQVVLARIGAAHRAHAPTVDPLCVECAHTWPCPTYEWAMGRRDDLNAPWNRAAQPEITS